MSIGLSKLGKICFHEIFWQILFIFIIFMCDFPRFVIFLVFRFSDSRNIYFFFLIFCDFSRICVKIYKKYSNNTMNCHSTSQKQMTLKDVGNIHRFMGLLSRQFVCLNAKIIWIERKLVWILNVLTVYEIIIKLY